MGLDLFLIGKKWLWPHDAAAKHDGFRIASMELELGYWRKNYCLDKMFMQWVPKEQTPKEVLLTVEKLNNIRHRIIANDIPDEPGVEYFWDTAFKEDVKTKLWKAAQWVKEKHPDTETRAVLYRGDR